MTTESGHQQHEIHNVQHPLKIDMPEAGEGDLQSIETNPGITELIELVTKIKSYYNYVTEFKQNHESRQLALDLQWNQACVKLETGWAVRG